MKRLTEEEMAKGRKRFLDQNEDIRCEIDGLTQAQADAVGMTLESLRRHETMKALANYAYALRIDSQELFFSCIADTAEESAQMLSNAIKRSSPQPAFNGKDVKKIYIPTVVAFLALLIPVAHAAPKLNCSFGGAELAKCAAEWERAFANGDRLDDADHTWNVSNYEGFVSGVFVSTLQSGWCPKEAFASDAVFSLVAKDLREHPEKWGERSDKLILSSLSRAWPCGQKTKARGR